VHQSRDICEFHDYEPRSLPARFGGGYARDTILLDVGCCSTYPCQAKTCIHSSQCLIPRCHRLVGSDVRRIAADGYPDYNILACELHQVFLDLGSSSIMMRTRARSDSSPPMRLPRCRRSTKPPRHKSFMQRDTPRPAGEQDHAYICRPDVPPVRKA